MKFNNMFFRFYLVLLTFAKATTFPSGYHKPLEKFWQVFDTNGDGRFSLAELNYFSESGNAVPGNHLQDIASAWDRNRDGIITFQDMQHQVPMNTVVEQVHLSLTSDPSEMIVMFASLTEMPAKDCHVLYRQSGESDWASVFATPKTYTVPGRWWEPEGWQGFLYTATMTDLTPGMKYEYQISSPTLGDRSGLGFTAAPSLELGSSGGSSTAAAPLRLAVWGDMGTYMPLGFKVMEKVISDHKVAPYDFSFHFGDISYAGVDSSVPFLNVTKDDEWQFIWDLFGRQVEPLSAAIPFMVGVGNHDMFYNSNAYSARFTMPGEQTDGQGNDWYSFVYGNVHVVSVSSEHDYSPGSKQMLWLAKNLAQAQKNRAKVPWVIFNIHRPLYSSDKDGWNSHHAGAPLQSAFEPLLLKFGVDLVLVGHQHCYERIHPVVNGTVVSWPSRGPNQTDTYSSPAAPVHVVVGSAGAMQVESWVDPPPQWSATRLANGDGGQYTDTFGYGNLQVFNRTHLSFQFVPITGNKVDAFWIVKI